MHLCVQDRLAACEVSWRVYMLSAQSGGEEPHRRVTVWICVAHDTGEQHGGWGAGGKLSLCTCGATPPRPGEVVSDI